MEAMSESGPSSAAARVVVGVSGSPGSLVALRLAAVEARRRSAVLWPVLAWEPPGGELSARRSAAAAVLVEDWERMARERLLDALRCVFGEDDAGLPLHAVIARGSPGRALVATADREDDLLVLGAGRRGLAHRAALWPSVGRYCLTHAGCPVLVLPPSPLQPALAAAHRRNAWRLRLDTGRMEREFARLPPDA